MRQVDLKDRKRIMDIGGGSGAYCIAAAKEHVGIFDLPGGAISSCAQRLMFDAAYSRMVVR